MASPTQDLPIDELLRVLADPQRRMVLQHLRENDADPVEIDELVDVLVPLTGEPPATVPQDDRRRLRIKLQHVHLPRLADAGTIDYDLRSGTVRYIPVDRVESLLGFLTDELD